jgi:hypothetical protein
MVEGNVESFMLNKNEKSFHQKYSVVFYGGTKTKIISNCMD